MADYIDTIRIGSDNEKPIWDTAITVNGAPFDNGTHNITIPTDVKPTPESSRLLSSGTLHDLLINTTEVAEYTVKLPTSGWSSSHSITITSETEGNEFLDSSIITLNSVIIASPSPTSSENIANYGKSSIYCSSSGLKSLTFSRVSSNSSLISVNVLVMNIRTSF